VDTKSKDSSLYGSDGGFDQRCGFMFGRGGHCDVPRSGKINEGERKCIVEYGFVAAICHESAVPTK
jgi:hypothetical protein